jgi:hypothetical protein
MTGIVVLDLVLLVVLVVAVVGQIGFRRTARACRRAAAASGLLVPPPRESLDDVERVESSIAARVVAGDLTGEAYRRRMAELAAADDVRRPMNVPGA